MRLCYVMFQIVPFLPAGCGFYMSFVFLSVSKRFSNSGTIGEKNFSPSFAFASPSAKLGDYFVKLA